MKTRFYILLASLWLAIGSVAQENKFQVSGYAKFLGTFNFFNTDYLPPNIPPTLAIPKSYQDYQIHNRFDFRYYANEHWSFGAGMRNRLLWGYQVSNFPGYTQLLEFDPGLVDMSFFWWDQGDVLLHTIFDRAWGQWENDKWIVRMGRQRINWGVNTVWNPNDIFNQYNYLDFDYEERPGSDALRIQFFPNYSESFELGFSPSDTLANSVAALLYKFNRWNYDFQVLGGYYRSDAIIGGAWAGNIYGAGFKGELSYYKATKNSRQDNLTFSTTLDYQFKSGLYLMLSYLYNGLGENRITLSGLVQTNSNLLDAKNLFFFRNTIFNSVQFNITPLFNANLALMYTPDLKNLIFFPTLSYSIMENLDALLAVQHFVSTNPYENNNVEWMSALIFVRLKYSF